MRIQKLPLRRSGERFGRKLAPCWRPSTSSHTFFLFCCIAELAIKPCRSSRSNTRGGFEKFHDTCKTLHHTHTPGVFFLARSCLGQVLGGVPFSQRSELATAPTHTQPGASHGPSHRNSGGLQRASSISCHV